VRLRIFRVNNVGGIVQKDELSNKINIVNNASKELHSHKDVLFKTLIKLNDEIYNYNFITKLKFSDEFAELNVWGSRFKITWDLKAKKDSDNKLSKQDFFLVFTLYNSSNKYNEMASFTITYDKQISYDNEESLCLDNESDIIRIFNLIFEKYFNNNILESIYEELAMI